MRAIAISLSPNTLARDVWLALKLLFSPWRWFAPEPVSELEDALAKQVGVDAAITFDSGRTAWLAILKALGVGSGDEVIVQAFTCIVVPNSIRWVGATPVYVDIDPDTYNLDLEDLERKISPQTKVIMVQHTFGKLAPMEKILALAKREGIRVVEDCAHALGAMVEVGGKQHQAGSMGDAAFFSFGRDKVISSVFGGAALTSNGALAQKIRDYQQSLSQPSLFWVKQQLLHPIFFALILPFYRFKIGRIKLYLLQRLGLLSMAVYPLEKRAIQHPSMPRRLPGALAILALDQLARLTAFNDRRQAIAARYAEALSPLAGDNLILPEPTVDAIWLRYTIRTTQARKLIEVGRKKGIYLGDWYRAPLIPVDIDLAAICYKPGTCLVAEAIAPEVVNLPTYPKLTDEEVERVIQLVKEVVGF